MLCSLTGKRKQDNVVPVKRFEITRKVHSDEHRSPVYSRTSKSDQRIGKKQWISEGRYRCRMAECGIGNSGKGPKTFPGARLQVSRVVLHKQ